MLKTLYLVIYIYIVYLTLYKSLMVRDLFHILTKYITKVLIGLILHTQLEIQDQVKICGTPNAMLFLNQYMIYFRTVIKKKNFTFPFGLIPRF